ncbi:DUF2690 domain-containing protein [Kitasatospora sp. NPDC047058]|uniref:DUF2690 domain-containing protein n=1 Tax=Kitasatospora sp. NPDC047058 TaxID=3155620 RepID=UPI0033FC9A1B
MRRPRTPCPDKTSCQYDAYTARYGTGAGRGIELRYSPSCRAVWARALEGGAAQPSSSTARITCRAFCAIAGFVVR